MVFFKMEFEIIMKDMYMYMYVYLLHISAKFNCYQYQMKVSFMIYSLA